MVAQSLVHMDNDKEEPRDRGRFVELENTQEQSNVQWPTIEEFKNTNVGLEKINEYIDKVKFSRFDSQSKLNTCLSAMENITERSRSMLAICN